MQKEKEMFMNAIVFLGTQKSGSSREAIRAAAELGYYTVLLTDSPKQIRQRDEYPDVHLMQFCNLDDLEDIRRKIYLLKNRSIKVRAICCFTDPYCGLASKVAAENNLPHFSTEAIFIMQNKLKSREVIKDTPYCPKYQLLTKDKREKSEEIGFPAVVKYIDSDGSKDVYFCENETDYWKYTDKLFEKYNEGILLFEEYLDGPQYIVETVVVDGIVNIIAIIAQEIQHVNEHFIITGYKLLIDYDEDFINPLRKATETIIQKHGLTFGPSHLEIRHVKGEWKLVEINPRISGAGMNNLLKFGLGINLVKETLKLLLNREAYLEPRYRTNTFAQYVIVNKAGKLFSITGKAKAASMPGVKFLYIKPRKGGFLIPPESMGNRYAYVIATGDSEDEARERAKEAASFIRFNLFSENQPVNNT
jgi:biotin carboxylase